MTWLPGGKSRRLTKRKCEPIWSILINLGRKFTVARTIRGRGDPNALGLGSGNLVAHPLANKQARIEQGRDARAAAEDAREIVDFYRLGSDCLWITFAKDHLWWTFAGPKVVWLGLGKGHGERLRKSIGGWRNTDTNGKPLKTNTLNTKLTKVANYRRTICAVDAQEYLLRRINGLEGPL